MCLTPNPFSHVLTLAKHGESMWKTEGCFWLRTGDPTGPLTQWACRWPVPGLQGSSVPFRLVRGWAPGAMESCSLGCSSLARLGL